jgi:hypothetical protein
MLLFDNQQVDNMHQSDNSSIFYDEDIFSKALFLIKCTYSLIVYEFSGQFSLLSNVQNIAVSMSPISTRPIRIPYLWYLSGVKILFYQEKMWQNLANKNI